MTRDEWTALAERCEKATGPDREIDVALCIAADAPRILTHLLSKELRPLQKGQWYACGDGYVSHPEWVYLDGAPGKSPAERYTASLDAITALVERELPGCGFVVKSRLTTAKTIARIFLRRWEAVSSDYATTPALALCAAFCRAMASKETA